MIACLDMYTWPESASIFSTYWRHVRDHLHQAGINAPQDLSIKDEDLRSAADDASLLLGQVCGITYARDNEEQHRFTPLGAFICDDADLPAGQYCSVLVARDNDEIDLDKPQNLTAAINGYGSLSGWIVLAQYFSGQSQSSPFKADVISGGHRHSAEKVAEGTADIAALDIISWKMLECFAPDLTSKLRVVAKTPPRPGLPLVTSAHHDAALIAALKDALYASMALPDMKAAMATLGILGLHANDPEDYLDLLAL